MEPTICKPGAYKTPGVYKGAGGVYNGNGLYKGGFKSPWVLLNNCDNLDNNKCSSIIGDSLYTNDLSNFGYLVNSTIYPGSNSIKRNNSKYAIIRDIITDDVFTIEFYLSDIPNGHMTDVYAMNLFCIENSNNHGLYIGGFHASNFETSFPVVNWDSGGIYKAMQLPIIEKGHFAAVVNKLTSRVTAFLDGAKIGSYTFDINAIGDKIEQNGTVVGAILEFFAVRNGDFSNNLESFTVPTQKYSL